MDEFDQFLAQSYGRFNSPENSQFSSRDEEVFRAEPVHRRRDDRCSSCQAEALDFSPTEQEDTVDESETEDTFDDRLISSLQSLGDDWDLGQARPRSQSMPSGDHRPRLKAPRLARLRRRQEDLHKVRAFQLTEKGLVKGGERYVSGKGTSKPESTKHMPPRTGPFKVLLLGASGVGKRALIREFIDPDTSNHPFNSLDDDSDRCVSILLDGEESTMEFVDLSDREVDEFISAEHIDAYVVVYSVEDKESFQTALDRLYETRQEVGRHVALILVANKTDLVRTRVVHADEGKTAAKTYDCKYIEVSAAIDHKIDELLVGILKQIRLIQSKMRKTRHRPHVKCDIDEPCCLHKARQNVIARIFKGEANATKSCDNLYVL